MPKLLQVMGWNIENFGASKYKKHKTGPELVELIAAVMRANFVELAGFSEIRSNLAKTIGIKLTATLNTAAGVVSWKYKASPQFVKGRLEQYLMVWDSSKVDTDSARASPFQSSYNNPTPPPSTIGFPKITKSRPPFVGYFELKTGMPPGKKLLYAIHHSPEPGFWPDARDSAKNMAKITEFKTEGETCLIIGDFNVKSDSDVDSAGSFGAKAFGELKAAHFDQSIDPRGTLTSLVKAYNLPTMVAGDYMSAPYDQVFFRTQNSAGVASLFTAQNAIVDDLIVECYQGKYLEARLGSIADKRNGYPAGTTTYGHLAPGLGNAFYDFRRYVSDHLPVFVEIHG